MAAPTRSTTTEGDPGGRPLPRRRTPRRRSVALLVAAAGVVAVLARTGSVGWAPVVPDVTGLALDDAVAMLNDAGVTGEPMSGGSVGGEGPSFTWEDPSGHDAVVVAQEPAGGTRVESGAVVGLRTAVVSTELCRVMTEVAPRRGDALDLARSDGFWDMLRRAAPLADVPLADAVTALLAHHDAGGSIEDAPPMTLDRITVHHDACSRR